MGVHEVSCYILGLILGFVLAKTIYDPQPHHHPLSGQVIRNYQSRRIELCVSQLERDMQKKMDTNTLNRPPWVLYVYSTPAFRNLTDKIDRDNCMDIFTKRLSDDRTAYSAEYQCSPLLPERYTIMEV